jgi:hypothetical protein
LENNLEALIQIIGTIKIERLHQATGDESQAKALGN